jgi:integrase
VYVATTDQVWQLYELFPERMRLAVVLGAFVGLRLAEACGLRVADVDFLRAVVYPKVQYPARPLKTKTSRTPIPVPVSLIEQCSAQIAAYGRYETLLTGEDGASCSRGRSSAPCEKPAVRLRASLRASATTTYGTTSPAC